nr:hypothetical protein [Tanacetum cinerariifolium]
NNKDAHLDYLRHLKESVETIRDIVEEAKVVRPLDRSIVSACRYTQHSHELLEYAIGTCPQGSQQRTKQLAHTLIIRKKQVTAPNLLIGRTEWEKESLYDSLMLREPFPPRRWSPLVAPKWEFSLILSRGPSPKSNLAWTSFSRSWRVFSMIIDKDENPSAGSDRGTKIKKSSKDAEPSKSSKLKESKSSSSFKGTQSQSKSLGKSTQAEKPEFEAADTEMQQDQKNESGHIDDQPDNKAAPKHDCKPLPLIEDRGHQVVPDDYFINNDLEYLKGGSSSSEYATSTTRTKAAKTVLHDIAFSLEMDYLPKRHWSNLEKKRSCIMIKAIDKLLFERKLMRNLEKFVGGREYGNDLRLLERTIWLCFILSASISGHSFL